jgi:glucose/arabinose dehydrogenase
VKRGVHLIWWFLSATLPAAAMTRAEYRIETVVDGLERPFAIAVLSARDILVTEKRGRVRQIRDGRLLAEPLAGVPDVLAAGEYDGLQDIVPHPQFNENRIIYLSMVHGVPDANAVRVVRARYDGGSLQDVTPVFTASPLKATINHPGARLAFMNDETLLITVGDGYEYREQAQSLSSHLGKVVRITDSGAIPADNPFVDAAGKPRAIWSYGHRHPQGIVVDPLTGRVYEHEHGPRGGDELNRIEKGRNYGWPLATFGTSYSGAFVSPYRRYEGTQPPLMHWTPSLAPCGIALCRGCQWREWEGSLFIGMLAGQQVRRVRLSDAGSAEQESLFDELNARIRDVRFGPDGALYLLQDDGVLQRVSAKQR